MKIIDPHLHLFNIEQGEYHWLKKGNPPFWPDKKRINKSFSEHDLALLPPLTLEGFVHIEAGFDNTKPWRELIYLQESYQQPFTAIANIDLTLDSKEFTLQLENLQRNHSFIGVRHILDEQVISILTNKQVVINLNTLNALNNIDENNRIPDNDSINNKNFIFEVQMSFEDELSVDSLCKVIADNTNIIFIINHAGFPAIDSNSKHWLDWKSNLTTVASYPNCAIKCSGWEMIDRQYTNEAEWLNQCLQTCFTIFGTKRMMLASNFPLCLFSHASYHSYWEMLLNTTFMLKRTVQEKSALCYHNALNYYQLAYNG